MPASDLEAKKPRVLNELQGDDLEVVNRFAQQLDSCRLLEVLSHDEAEFSKWGKEKIQSLADVRGQIYQKKKKSLKRRKDAGSDDLSENLEAFMQEISGISDLVKKLCAGNAEGRQLYDMLTAMPDITASQAVWLRAVRAMAFDNLKLLQWRELFEETYMLCRRHGEPRFFTLLVSQILQRLIKAVPISKGVTNETTSNLRAFVDCMSDVGNAAKTRPGELEASRHENVLNDVRLVLDFAAPPNLVAASLRSLSSETSHWAAVAFALPQGKKILDATQANAKNKEAVADILEVLNSAEDAMKKSGLSCVDSVFAVGLSRCFTPDHAVMVSKCLRDLAPKATRGLKGADRDKLVRVQKLAKSCVFCIFYNHITNELVPYVSELATAINERTVFDTALLTESRCVLHLADGCGHGEEALLDKLKDFSEFMCALSKKLCGTDTVSEKDASALTATWESKSKAVIAAIAAFIERSESVGDDPQKQMKEVLDDLKANACEVGQAMEASLQNQLRDGLLANVLECMRVLMLTLASAETVVEEEIADTFYQNVERAQLVSTILGAEGKTDSAGIAAASSLFACVEAYALAKLPSDDGNTKSQNSLAFVKSYVTMMQDTCDILQALRDLNAIVKVFSDDDASVLTSVMEKLAESHRDALNTFIGQCQTQLDSNFIDENSVEIPEEFFQIDSHSAIDEGLVRTKFDMKFTTTISNSAVKLEEAIEHAKQIAVSCGMPVGDMINLAKYEGSYAAAIRWLATGNVLYSLTSKAVSRALLTGTKPAAKALSALNDAMKAAAEHKVEIPPGLQAVVTKIVQPDAPTDVQPTAAVP